LTRPIKKKLNKVPLTAGDKPTTTRFDVTEHMRLPEDRAARWQDCAEEGNNCDAVFIGKALGEIAHAKRMAQVARDADPSREGPYKALPGARSPCLRHSESHQRTTLEIACGDRTRLQQFEPGFHRGSPVFPQFPVNIIQLEDRARPKGANALDLLVR
jgi:probable addiction module antidote protein